MRKLFASKRKELTGRQTELHTFDSMQNTVRIKAQKRMCLAEHVARTRRTNAYWVMGGKPEGKKNA